MNQPKDSDDLLIRRATIALWGESNDDRRDASSSGGDTSLGAIARSRGDVSRGDVSRGDVSRGDVSRIDSSIDLHDSHRLDDDLDDEFQWAAAAIELYGASRQSRAMPSGLRETIAQLGDAWWTSQAADRAVGSDRGRGAGLDIRSLADDRAVVKRDGEGEGHRYVRSASERASVVQPAGSKGAAWGWFAAAACLLLACFAWATRGGGVTGNGGDGAVAIAFADQRKALLLESSDVLKWSWQLGSDSAVQEGKSGGDVVWSNRSQKGFMRLVGLKPNDPSKEQYQLWIVDSRRSDPQPVDGGVFDVTADGEVIVPIDAKLPIGSVAKFVVTVEPPGGVVVSKLSRVPLVAGG
jgi:hypothetical protein